MPDEAFAVVRDKGQRDALASCRAIAQDRRQHRLAQDAVEQGIGGDEPALLDAQEVLAVEHVVAALVGVGDVAGGIEQKQGRLEFVQRVLDRRGDPGLLVQGLSDQHGPEQMGDDRRQQPAKIVVDKPVLHQAEIGKAVGVVVQENTGRVIQSLRARPFLVELAVAEFLHRHPIFRAVDLADVEKPDFMRRIELAVMVEIGLHEVRCDADLVRNANLASCALRHQAGAMRAGVFDDAPQRVVPQRLAERRVVDVSNEGQQPRVRFYRFVSQEPKPFDCAGTRSGRGDCSTGRSPRREIKLRPTAWPFDETRPNETRHSVASPLDNFRTISRQLRASLDVKQHRSPRDIPKTVLAKSTFAQFRQYAYNLNRTKTPQFAWGLFA